MKTARRFRPFPISLYFAVFSIGTLFLAAVNITAQVNDSREKLIKLSAAPYRPIEVISLKNNEKTLYLDQKFRQETDWLQGLTIKYKNVSGKNVIWICLRLEFPETRASGNMMMSYLTSGRNPLISEEAVRSAKPGQPIEMSLIPIIPVTPIKPGETIDLTLDTKNYEGLKKFLARRHSLDSLSQVEVTIELVLYDDGTGNSVGEDVSRSDPNRPNVWIPVASKKPE